MSTTLNYILNKFNISLSENGHLPIELPNVGRNDMASWLSELGFKIGIEVGVAAGDYSRILCRANPGMKIYGIDPFVPYHGYTDFTWGETFDAIYKEASGKLSGYSNYELIKEFSMDALKRFEDNSLDFVYIDANHSEPYVTEDITEWSKKIKSGGIIAGHDYAVMRGRHGLKITYNVKKSIQRYTKENNINPWFVVGAEAKIPGTVRDDIRSWMFIKE